MNNTKTGKLGKTLLLVFCLAALLLIAGCVEEEKPTPIGQTETTPEPIYNPLTGLEVDEEISARVLLVSVDNVEQARPQSGVSKADIVYELPAEGGIPRLVMLFYSQSAEKIGPVRSARDYFVSLAQGWDGLFAHCGWSPQAQELLQRNVVDYVNEIAYSSYFWRDNSRSAPHNLYTSTDLLYKCLEERDFATVQENTVSFLPFAQPKDLTETAETTESTTTEDEKSGGFLSGLFGKDNDKEVHTVNGEDVGKESTTDSTTTTDSSETQVVLATDITIKYPYCTSVYAYDSESGLYNRFIKDTPYIDKETGEQLQVANIIVQHVSSFVVDNAGRLQIDMLAGGKALLFSRGQVIEGTWQRDNVNSCTRYFDNNGNEFVLTPGQTWVQICDQAVVLTY